MNFQVWKKCLLVNLWKKLDFLKIFSLIVKNEKENDELNESRNKVHSLEIEKANRLNEKEKFDKVCIINKW